MTTDTAPVDTAASATDVVMVAMAATVAMAAMADTAMASLAQLAHADQSAQPPQLVSEDLMDHVAPPDHLLLKVLRAQPTHVAQSDPLALLAPPPQ